MYLAECVGEGVVPRRALTPDHLTAMYIVLETYADCLPEIPMVTFPTYEEALEVLHGWAIDACALAEENGAEETYLNEDDEAGEARVHTDRETHYWVGRVTRVPGS